MSLDVLKRLEYIQKMSKLLQSKQQTDELTSLIQFYGRESKEIQFKNQIKSFAWDTLKLSRCKKCHHLVDFCRVKVKVDNRFVRIKCDKCHFIRRYPIKSEHHTRFEKILFDSKDQQSDTSKEEVQKAS